MPHPSETDHQTPACPTLRATERPRVSPHGHQDRGACAEQPGGRGTQKVPRAPLEGKSRVRRGTRRGGPGPRARGPGRRGHGEQEPRVASRAARTQSQGALLGAGGRGPSEPLGAAGTRAAGQRGPRCRLRPLRWPVPSSLRLAQAALGAGTTNREGARGPGAEDRDAGAGATGARGARTAGGTRVAHECGGGRDTRRTRERGVGGAGCPAQTTLRHTPRANKLPGKRVSFSESLAARMAVCMVLRGQRTMQTRTEPVLWSL